MLPQRRSVRLEDRDYGAQGSYFVTICTAQRRCNLARIDEAGVTLSKFGRIIESEWQTTLSSRPFLVDRHFVTMPNHVHLLFSIMRSNEEDRARQALPLHGLSAFQKIAPESVGTIIGGFKSGVTRAVNVLRSTPGCKFWQRGYYEHVVRSEDDFATIAEYIHANPERWLRDRENLEGEPDKRELDFWKDRYLLRL